MNVRELRATGPIDLLDAASRCVRSIGIGEVARAWIAGAIPAAVLVFLFYLERVESMRSFRLGAAFLLVIAWCVRAVMLRKVAAVCIAKTAPEIPLQAQSIGNTCLLSIVAGAGLWVWLWILVALAQLSPFACVPFLPVLALRGAVAPSWIARAGAVREDAFGSWGAAVSDTSQSRASGLLAEFLLLVGVLGLGLNLFLISTFVISMGRTYLGLDLALVESFVSFRNDFAIAVLAALSFVLIEPYRAALSALHFVGARARTEGIDLSASIDAAVAHTQIRRSAPTVVVLLLSAWAAFANVAHAQDPKDPSAGLVVEIGTKPNPGLDPTPAPPTTAENARDNVVREEVTQILQRSEYQEFQDAEGASFLDELRRRFHQMLDEQANDPPEVHTMTGGGIGLPGAQLFLIVAGVFLVAVLIALFLGRAKTAKPESATALANVALDIREQPPAVFLDEAAQLAAAGKYREALRALYLATLVALDRQRLITFDPHLTNWQYMRQMPRSEARELFGRFTRAFDFKWYGHEATVEADYVACRALADRICAPTAEVAA